MSPKVFIGTDSGATTTKIAAVWENGEAVTTKLLQRPTNAEKGRNGSFAGGWTPSPNFWRKTSSIGRRCRVSGWPSPDLTNDTG